MVRWLILQKLASVERELGVSVEYLRHILGVSLGAFLKFTKIVNLVGYRRVLPPGPFHVSQIVATRDADCGTCLQIAVRVARKAGVSAEIIRAILESRTTDLSEELSDVYSFVEAVVKATDTADASRERIRQRYGEAGLVELALAIGVCRVLPTTKRALGYAISCSQVKIEV